MILYLFLYLQLYSCMVFKHERSKRFPIYDVTTFGIEVESWGPKISFFKESCGICRRDALDVATFVGVLMQLTLKPQTGLSVGT